MNSDNHIVAESREFVEKLLAEKLAPWVAYHDYQHTDETYRASREIGRACGLGPAEIEIVLIAALFHDTGYIETVVGHEERSVAIATGFLRKKGYPEDNIRAVAGCIMATTVPQRPRNLLEQVVCDADMLYVGREEFFHKNDLLRSEQEGREGTGVDPVEWRRRSLAFLEAQKYHTPYCRGKLSEGLKDNIDTLRKQVNSRG
jgi:predicted metal-dependent HD superfamily phosphohydrolase